MFLSVKVVFILGLDITATQAILLIDALCEYAAADDDDDDDDT